VTKLGWGWRDVAEPAAPQAAVACGPAARRLLDRLAALPTEALTPLLATAHEDMLVVIGPEAALPWVSEIAYAAPAAEAPSLWLPVLRRPDVPLDLLERALLRRHGRQPLLLWPDPPSVMPLDRQLPVSLPLIGRIAALWRPA
jgi:hypothetical protein